MRNKFFAVMSVLSMGMAIAVLPMGGNPAHAGPAEPENSVKGSPIGKMGTVTDRVQLNTKRAEAAKRLKARRAAAAAAAKKAEALKSTEGGAK